MTENHYTAYGGLFFWLSRPFKFLQIPERCDKRLTSNISRSKNLEFIRYSK